MTCTANIFFFIHPIAWPILGYEGVIIGTTTKFTNSAGNHAIGDEGVALRDIAAVIGRRLNVPVVSKAPEETVDHFSWLMHFVMMDNPTSSSLTQERFGWRPD